MAEFWESNFIEKKEMWGFEPVKSALLTRDFFLDRSVKNVLVPGFGYGRNAQVFQVAGMHVTGIEISPTAIDMARRHYGADMLIYQGSVTDMPFDDRVYEGVFCHALIHLLDKEEREKFIRDCYQQLAPGGFMLFTLLSNEAPIYGQGKEVDQDRYESFPGVKMFFYDQHALQEEFGAYGLLRIDEVKESYPFFLITCQKPTALSPTQDKTSS